MDQDEALDAAPDGVVEVEEEGEPVYYADDVEG